MTDPIPQSVVEAALKADRYAALRKYNLRRRIEESLTASGWVQMREALLKARTAILLHHPEPTENLDAIDAALKGEQQSGGM